MAPRHTGVVRPDDSYWAEFDKDKDNILQLLDALGASDPNVKGPNRYAVQRGKMVPQRQCVDVVLLPSQNEIGSRRSKIAPPRQSSRPSQRRDRRGSNSAHRPASSVYSHSDGELSTPTPEYMLASSNEVGGLAALQISPPSSPDINGAAQRLDAGDVSPIEDDFDYVQRSAFADRRHLDTRDTFSQQRAVSSPIPTQPGSHDQDAVPPPRRQAALPPDERAQSPQIHVHTTQVINYPENGQFSRDASEAQQIFGCQTTISSAANDRSKSSSPSFSQRMRLRGRAKPATVDLRPPWNGASGQSVTMHPVMDDLNVAPLTVPPKVNQRLGRSEKSRVPPVGPETSSTIISISSRAGAMRRLLQGSSKNKPRASSAQTTTQLIAEKQHPMPERAYPSPPNTDILAQEADRSYFCHDLQTQALGSHPPDLFRPSLSVIKRKPPPSAFSSNESPASNYKYADNGISGGAAESSGAAAVAEEEEEEEEERGRGGPSTGNTLLDSCYEAASSDLPPSRFSITTYATSDPGTPRLSSEEMVPPLPVPPPVLGVMDRSRPVTGGRSVSSGSQPPMVVEMPNLFMSTGKLQQQAQYASAGGGLHNRTVSDSRSSDHDGRSSAGSMSKPLPLAPNQGKSGDLVSQLDAQISALFFRRVNIEKSIKQMTELMPRDILLASEQVMRKREEEKQKVDNLRLELAEIQREEHELGLKLYRARKRQEKEADFESTPLWVSRVAG
ncbi:hypothetical protein E4U55_003905 [Claviceps digitariae]|nr:hypothetical protein E4U55_003905 [Claviceps digitariae]